MSSDTSFDTVIGRVRQALGRTGPLTEAPVPPAFDEPITRLVHSDIGLPELFARSAASNKMKVSKCPPETLGAEIIKFLKTTDVKKIAISVSPLIERLGVAPQLREAGFETTSWDQMTLDELYDYDCGLTDVALAVAETGSLVIIPSEKQGRGLSLVPPIHIAIVEPKNLLPDLVDLFQHFAKEPKPPAAVNIITGPSKTADIEMNLVVGVHGPGVVQIFLLS